MPLAKITAAPLCLLALTLASSAIAQTSEITNCDDAPNRTLKADCTQKHMQERIVYLTNVTTQNEANEILVSARNLLDPSTKIYLVASKNAIVLATYPQELDREEAFIHSLDTPHKNYTLTFTLKDDSDSKPALPPQTFTINALDGQRVTLKQGSKYPIITGSFGPAADAKIEGSGVQTQYTYLDIGTNFDITLNSTGSGATLTSKIEQSAIASEKSAYLPHDPVVRQTVLSGVTALTLNKPTTIGKIDIPGTTHRSNIEVTLQTAP